MAVQGEAPKDRPRTTVPGVRARKRAGGSEPLVVLTAYDYPSARAADAAGVDVILVGDSLANVVLGYEDTLQVGIEEMAHHVGAVARARPRALLVADMPWMSYHISVERSLENASRLVRAGAEAVKLEGGRRRAAVIEALVAAEIPVMGHLGLTPQSVHAFGGYRVQAREEEAAQVLLEDAKVLAECGCFAVVLEAVPERVAARVTEAIGVPTIGIGAGASCDGQVLVFHDLIGYREGKPAKFVRQYADLSQAAREAISAWAADVRSGSFPSEAETYH